MLRALLVAIVTLTGLSLSLANPIYSLMLYNWYSFTSPLDLTYGLLDGYRISLVVAIVLIFTTIVYRKKLLLNEKITWLCLIFIGHILLSLSFQPHSSFNSILFSAEILTKTLAITVISAVLLVKSQNFKLNLYSITFSLGILAAYYGIAGLFAGSRSIIGAGKFGDNNFYAVMLVASIPLMIATVYQAKNITLRLFNIFLLLGTTLAVLLTFSRGGLVALVAVFAYLILKIRKFLLIPFLIVVLLAIYYLSSVHYIKGPEEYSFSRDFRSGSVIQETIDLFQVRMYTLLRNPENIGSAESRMHFWKVAYLMAKEKPIFGVGLGNYSDNYNRYDFTDGKYGKNRSVHSIYFSLLAETGFVGLFFFLLIIFFALLNLWKTAFQLKRQGSRDYWLITFLPVSLVGFLVGSLFVTTYRLEVFWSVVAMAIACPYLAKNQLEVLEGDSENISD